MNFQQNVDAELFQQQVKGVSSADRYTTIVTEVTMISTKTQ